MKIHELVAFLSNEHLTKSCFTPNSIRSSLSTALSSFLRCLSHAKTLPRPLSLSRNLTRLPLCSLSFNMNPLSLSLSLSLDSALAPHLKRLLPLPPSTVAALPTRPSSWLYMCNCIALYFFVSLLYLPHSLYFVVRCCQWIGFSIASSLVLLSPSKLPWRCSYFVSCHNIHTKLYKFLNIILFKMFNNLIIYHYCGLDIDLV